MMQGRYTRPQKMVTHNWSNLFRDMVAAVVADALDEAEYQMIAYFLDRDIDVLARWIRAGGVHLRTYWVCAFSVNQHLGICSTLSILDPVTDELHPTCDCELFKAWNDTPPTAGGRGIPCEMNKSQDMMR